MKFLKTILLPIYYAMAGFSFSISSLQIFLCNVVIKIINVLTGKNNTKIQIFFSKQKEHPENLLLITLYVVTIISLVNIFIPKTSYKANDEILIYTYENVNTIDNNNDNDNSNIGNENIQQPENNISYDVNVDFDSLTLTNPDTVAYIIVEGTNISYPIVQTDNNDYYLTHDFKNNYSQKGSIFADYRNSFDNLSRNTIIYGHHRLDNTMFGPLDKLFTNNYYKNSSHRILLITRNKTYTFNVFSVYEINPEIYYLTTNFNSDNDYINFLNTLRSRSIYNFQETLDAGTKIITLSTCNLDNTGRLVVHAKLVGES